MKTHKRVNTSPSFQIVMTARLLETAFLVGQVQCPSSPLQQLLPLMQSIVNIAPHKPLFTKSEIHVTF